MPQQLGERAVLDVDPASPCQASDGRSPDRRLDDSLGIHADLGPPSSAAAGSLTPGHWEVINICHFHSIQFGSNPSKQEIRSI